MRARWDNLPTVYRSADMIWCRDISSTPPSPSEIVLQNITQFKKICEEKFILKYSET